MNTRLLELPERSDTPLKTTAGYWEGSLAEFLVFDGIQKDADRKLVEDWLRIKWF